MGVESTTFQCEIQLLQKRLAFHLEGQSFLQQLDARWQKPGYDLG